MRNFSYNFVDENGDVYDCIYYITEEGYCFKKLYINDIFIYKKRISEQYYINAYDYVKNF